MSERTAEPEVPAADRVPTLRIVAMPADTNFNGDIFGGWILAQMDLAGSSAAWEAAGGRLATVGVEAMSFVRPIKVGDDVSIYAHVAKLGRTSIRVEMESWVRRRLTGERMLVTRGTFTYVAINEDGSPRVLPSRQD